MWCPTPRRWWRFWSSTWPARSWRCGLFATTKDYGQVYFDTNRVIQEVGAAARYPVPSTHQVILHQTLKESV